MKQNLLLTISSVLAVLLFTLHFADDIVRGMEKGNVANLLAIPIFVAWLYGALVLAGRRWGYVVTLAFSLLGALVPVIHFRAKDGVAGGGIAESPGGFWFVWTLVALGVSASFAFVLSARGLWNSFRRPR